MEKIENKKIDLKDVYVARLEEIYSRLNKLYDRTKDKEIYEEILSIRTRIGILKDDIKYLRA